MIKYLGGFFDRALGYSYPEVHETWERAVVDKILLIDSAGKPILTAQGKQQFIPVYGEELVLVKKTVSTKTVIPDVPAMIFWLANRDRDENGKPYWKRVDDPPAKPGDGDELTTPEAVAEALVKASRAIMEAV